MNNADKDFELVKKVKAGCEKSFEEIVNIYKHPILNIIYRYASNYDDAEDIAQEVFVKVWKNIKSFKGKSKFSTWLYRITVNHCLNYVNKHKKDPISFERVVGKGRISDSPNSEIIYEKKTKSEIIGKALSNLPDRQKIALILSKFEYKSYSEISYIMGVSISSVESLIFRAKVNLKKELLPLREKGEI